MNKPLRRSLSLLGAVILLVTIGAAQQRLTAAKDASWSPASMSYLPQSDKLAPFLLGFTTTFADYLWIKTTIYFGGNYEGSRNFPWLINMVDMVTRLNPRFFPAYEFAGLMIPEFCRNPDAARVILERGASNLNEKRYKVLFYLGWLEYQYYHDNAAAAGYLARCAREKDAPALYAAMAASFYKRAGLHEEARSFLVSLYQTSDNPQVRRVIEEKLRDLGG